MEGWRRRRRRGRDEERIIDTLRFGVKSRYVVSPFSLSSHLLYYSRMVRFGGVAYIAFDSFSLAFSIRLIDSLFVVGFSSLVPSTYEPHSGISLDSGHLRCVGLMLENPCECGSPAWQRRRTHFPTSLSAGLFSRLFPPLFLSLSLSLPSHFLSSSRPFFRFHLSRYGSKLSSFIAASGRSRFR